MAFKLFYSLGFIVLSTILIAQPNTYLCHRPAIDIIIDGNIQDWQEAAWTSDFTDITGDPGFEPDLLTRVKMLWDDDYLYIAAEMEEPHLWATVSERDEVIYVDNDFEVFIDPDGDTHNYSEIEVNAFGTIWDLFLTRPYRDGTTPLNSFNIEGLKCEIVLNGTINDASDIDHGWVIEMAIPWNALVDLTPGKRLPYPGEYWRINFSRVQWELDVIDGKYIKATNPENGENLAEKNWVWTEQGSVDMHKPEKWGYVFFSESRVGEMAETYAIPEEELIKQALRELYFSQKTYKRLTSSYTRDIEFIDPEMEIRNTLDGDIIISASESQFNIEYRLQGRVWHIDHEGRVYAVPILKNWIWMHGSRDLPVIEWTERFQSLKSHGIDGVLLGGGNELLKTIIPLAKEEGIEIQAWRWVLNCNDQEVINEHPDWYSVSREGFTCLEKQPYVGYYKWLCPSNLEVREYLSERVRETTSTEGLSGFHMDYIRHPDVILPVALWSKYGLIQDHEMPEYDYCYCDVCRNKFKERHGYDPLSLDDPTSDENWRRFRYDIITNVVNELSQIVQSENAKLSAAVFPSPDIARKLVRQNWDNWPLNEVFPMVYHSFYNEDLAWIGETTFQGVYALGGNIPLYTGLYIPALSPKELSKAIEIAIEAGASGVSLFDYNAMTAEHWKAFEDRISKYK